MNNSEVSMGIERKMENWERRSKEIVREFIKENVRERPTIQLKRDRIKFYKNSRFYKSLFYIAGGVLSIVPSTQPIGFGLLGLMGAIDAGHTGVKLRKSPNPNTLADKPILSVIFDAIIKIIEILSKQKKKG